MHMGKGDYVKEQGVVTQSECGRSSDFWISFTGMVGGYGGVGYFVSTFGINEGVIRKYIELQSKEDAGQAELEF